MKAGPQIREARLSLLLDPDQAIAQLGALDQKVVRPTRREPAARRILAPDELHVVVGVAGVLESLFDLGPPGVGIAHYLANVETIDTTVDDDDGQQGLMQPTVFVERTFAAAFVIGLAHANAKQYRTLVYDRDARRRATDIREPRRLPNRRLGMRRGGPDEREHGRNDAQQLRILDAAVLSYCSFDSHVHNP